MADLRLSIPALLDERVHAAVASRLAPQVEEALRPLRDAGVDLGVEVVVALVWRDGGLRFEVWIGDRCPVSVPVGAVGLGYGGPGELDYFPGLVEVDGAWFDVDTLAPLS